MHKSFGKFLHFVKISCKCSNFCIKLNWAISIQHILSLNCLKAILVDTTSVSTLLVNTFCTRRAASFQFAKRLDQQWWNGSKMLQASLSFVFQLFWPFCPSNEFAHTQPSASREDNFKHGTEEAQGNPISSCIPCLHQTGI